MKATRRRMETGRMHKKYFIAVFIVILLWLGYLLFTFNAGKNRPNVVFITLDALRADHLNCYGYERNTSPHIQALAKKGVLFKQAISQASHTSASVGSIVSSLYPNHEIREAGYFLSPQDDNLVRVLKNEGYATAIFSNAQPTLEIVLSGIKDAFDVFDFAPVQADKVVNSADRWLGRNCRKPFFLWVYLNDTHWPYNIPDSYFSGFLSDNLHPRQDVPIAAEDGSRNEHYSFRVLPRHVVKNKITDTSYYIALYDGSIKFADEQVGLLLKRLADRGLLGNTLIVLFSDHGESLTEHNFFFNHSHFLYEGLIRVPLIMALPGRIPARVIERQVQSINIVPTVKEILKIKDDSCLEGRSMLPLMNNTIEQLDLYAFSETAYKPSPVCVRTEDWKLIRNRDTRYGHRKLELYNLKDDPRELHNLADTRLEVVASLVDRLNEWEKAAKTYSIGIKQDISSEDREKLRSLGYIG
ncbi:MAG: sulfatase [Candidatus Omnitrophota bacterium]